MSREFKVAVVGATGLVGETLIQVLEERNFPVAELHLLASNRSLGKRVDFSGRTLPVRELATFDFSGVDIAFFSSSAEVSREHAPKAAAAGCVVIDSSSEFRYQDDVPLVIPEVNPHAVAGYGERRIIANPDCVTIQLLVALKPLHDAAGIERIHVATYQSVSGAGKEAVEELAQQSIALLSGKGPVQSHVTPKQIAFNCVPQVDAFEESGETWQETQVVREARKVLEEPALRVNVTAVRVPVFYGHSAAVSIETRTRITPEEARALLEKAPGVQVLDQRRPGGYPTPATEAANRDTVYVGRIRQDGSTDRGLNLWVVADNVRKGAATNSIQIAEILAQQPI
jgi:aspartate-semialdehyde dehydrogenase